MITDVDAREVESSCVNVPKRGRGAAVITEEDVRKSAPHALTCTNGGENDCKSVIDNMDAKEFDHQAYDGERLPIVQH